MSNDVIEGTVLTGEDSALVKVPTVAQVTARIGTLTASRALNALEKGGATLAKLVETTDALYADNQRIGKKVKDNETFLGAYAYALHVLPKGGITASTFAEQRGITKARATQYGRTWRLFAEYEILPGTPEWSMTSTWQNSSDATVLFGKKGPKATREEFIAAYAASKVKPAAVTTGTDDTDTDTGTTDTGTTADTTSTTGDAPNTTDSTSASGTSATGDNRAAQTASGPDFTGWKGLDRVKWAQTALAVKRSDVKGKEAREVLAAIMAQCALLLESGE